MLDYIALRDGSVDMTTNPPSYFSALAESTVTYLFNTFTIDNRLENVQNTDRQALIRQHVIDIINAIAMTSNGITNAANMFNLLNQIMTN